MLAAQIAQEPSAGLYNGLIVAAFLGSTINGTIPLALGRLTGSKRAAAVRGLFLGFLVLPVGCLLTGALCGIPLSVLLHNTWPVLAVAVLLLLLFKSGSSAIGPIFNGISLAVRGLTLFGFCISVLQETSGIVLLEGLTPLAEIYPVICSIGAFLAGILPFFAFVQRLLTAPLAKLAARLQLEPASITGLVVTSANCIPTLLSLDTLEERGIGVMNIMMVSVTERTREIGTRKALGAPASDIRMQFITESVILCLIGGFIGIVLGLALGTVLSNVVGYAAKPSIAAILIAVGFSMAIGVFFGYYPANKAAKLDPIEALRYE